MRELINKMSRKILLLLGTFALNSNAMFADESQLLLPQLNSTQTNLLIIGLLICIAGMGFGLFEFLHLRKLKAHKSMLDVAEIIFQTAKTYLKQQGKFIVILEVLIGACIAFYFAGLRGMQFSGVGIILAWSIIGIIGSYSVAWYGIRVNTLANSSIEFACVEL